MPFNFIDLQVSTRKGPGIYSVLSMNKKRVKWEIVSIKLVYAEMLLMINLTKVYFNQIASG